MIHRSPQVKQRIIPSSHLAILPQHLLIIFPLHLAPAILNPANADHPPQSACEKLGYTRIVTGTAGRPPNP
eukprot:745906-Hanusia_phi.AAC.5